MAFFDGIAKIGDRLIVSQGSLQLRGQVIDHEFEGGPGNRAALSLGSLELISGNFPRSVEELKLNSNGWLIERESEPA